MKSKSLILASILAISTTAFAQTTVPADKAAPGGPAASRPAPPPGGPHGGPGGPRGPHEDGKSWTRAEAMAKAGQHFDRIDTNKDGVVSPEERKAAHEQMRAMHEKRAGYKSGADETQKAR